MRISKSSDLLNLSFLRGRFFRAGTKNLSDFNDLVVERFQYSHDVYRTLFDGNFSSPVTELLKKGAKVLDFKCGPGTWACDMSSDFRNSTFYAIESTRCFPTQKPFNVEFIESDTLHNGIPFKNDFFDFIFVHSSILCYSNSQWREIIIPELIRVLKPGGYLEMMETEPKLFGEGPETPVTTKYVEKFRASLRSHKIDPYVILEIPNMLNSTNQVMNIQEDIRKCPVGTWDNRLGEWGAKLITSLILHTLINLKLVREDNYDNIASKMMVEVNKVQSYIYNRRVWATKKSV